MIKTILFIIVIAIIAYFIYRSFNEAKLKGGDEGFSDTEIWRIVERVIENGDYGNSEYIPSNYNNFPNNYRVYLMFEYAKGINAYHKKFEDNIRFNEIKDVSYDIDNKRIDSYKYTNNKVELIILASEKDDGNIESCYKLKVKCDDFTDTDSTDLYRQPSNDMYRLNSITNEIDSYYDAEARVGPEALNNLNYDNNSTAKQTIIEPVTNENTNSINNNEPNIEQEDKKEDLANIGEQEAETTHKDEADIEQETEKETEADIDNQEAETINLNDQTTEQTEFGNQSNETGIEPEAEKELIELFNQTVNNIKDHDFKDYRLSAILQNNILNGNNVGKLQQTLKNADGVIGTFKKLDINKEYKIEYSEIDGWKIVRKED